MNASAPLAAALTEEEAKFLYEQRESLHFKVFAKTIAHQYSLLAAHLAVCPREEVDTLRGELRGLMRARNILCYGKVPDQKEKELEPVVNLRQVR